MNISDGYDRVSSITLFWVSSRPDLEDTVREAIVKEVVVFSGILIGEGQRVECRVRATKCTLDHDPSVPPAFPDYNIVDSATGRLPDGNYEVFAHGKRISLRREHGQFVGLG